MRNDFSYFRVMSSFEVDIPRLAPASGCPDYLFTSGRIDNPLPLRYKLALPGPWNPKMVDYHHANFPIISQKIHEIMSACELKEVQLLPVIIRGENGQEHDNYWAVHCLKQIRAIDVERSDCMVGKGNISKVNKLVLNQETLLRMPLKERLVFRLKEDLRFYLFHESVVQKIQLSNPDGVMFVNIKDWNDSASYFFS